MKRSSALLVAVLAGGPALAQTSGGLIVPQGGPGVPATAVGSGTFNEAASAQPAQPDVTPGLGFGAPGGTVGTAGVVPPAAVTVPPALQGVPPTPAPAFPGLPAPPQSPSTPSTTGPDWRTTAEQRPTVTAFPDQVAQVQNALAAQGFYRGPIDGVLSGSTRASISAFQAAARLPVTGQLDSATVVALGISNTAPLVATPPMTTVVDRNNVTARSAAEPYRLGLANGRAGWSPTSGNVGVGNTTAPMTPPAIRSERHFELSVPPPERPYPTPPIFIQP